ncbi:MAG: serine/threonine protein kinase [Labilithrix sp.]|nr:serine/threonine protein kinase [Labilithrix sp.]
MSTAAAIAQKTCPRCGTAFDREAVFCAKDGARLEPEDTDLGPDSDAYIGTVISGDIEIRSVAGAGAMGRVYRAHQRGIDRDVAVKILHRELSGNTQLVQRFHREAKIASKLQHPHVVEVFLAGQLPDGALYIVMEYLDGMSLASAIAAAGEVLPVERALTITIQICDAVGEGHARGIVHRDLKPENVMLVRRAEVGDWVKVLDFGIAKVSLGEQSMETAAGLIFGTARYISPEGAQGTTVGPPGDVYSLATMLYRMLAGTTPFDAEPVGLLIKHIHEQPPPLKSWPKAASIPDPLAKVIMDNLAKDPTRRAQGARAFAAQLAHAARESNISFAGVDVVARLSQVDVSAARAVSLDPTLDDVAFASLSPSPRAIVTPPPPAPAAVANPTAVSPAAIAGAPAKPLPVTTADHAPPSRGGDKRRGLAIVLLAFLLGAALAVIATQRLAATRDEDRATVISRARRALADSRYVSPPGDNVRDIVAAGQKKWPDDNDLASIRSDAAHEMVTRSMAARSAGDVGGARDLVRDAAQLDPSDHSARMLLGQYQEESDALKTEAGLYSGPPKLLFDAPAIMRPGQRMELSGRIAPGAGGPKAKIAGVKITVFENGKTTGGANVPLVSPDPRNVRATLQAPAPGSYDVVFEASVEGIIVRAQRDLDVVP